MSVQPEAPPPPVAPPEHGADNGQITSEVDVVLPGEALVADAARRSLDGRRRGLRRLWPFLGPAFVASVAYIDPGNFATNIASGAQFGYMLLWVVLAANLIGMVVQTQSAKLGIATGKNLPELCREELPAPTSFGLWIQAELVAMASDIAEVIGAALGLYLLFGIPLFRAGLIAGAGPSRSWRCSSGGSQARGRDHRLRRVVVAAFAFELFDPHPDAAKSPTHLFVPGFAGTESILLATGIIGATVIGRLRSVPLETRLARHRVNRRPVNRTHAFEPAHRANGFFQRRQQQFAVVECDQRVEPKRGRVGTDRRFRVKTGRQLIEPVAFDRARQSLRHPGAARGRREILAQGHPGLFETCADRVVRHCIPRSGYRRLTGPADSQPYENSRLSFGRVAHWGNGCSSFSTQRCRKCVSTAR